MTSRPAYLMERDDEGERLIVKGNRETTLEQLNTTGLQQLRPEPRVVDAGCGSGFVSRIMAEVLSDTYPQATLILLDGSPKRLSEAREHAGQRPEVQLQAHACRLESIPLDSQSVDYLFCRFVFEYLSDPQAVFNELYRVIRPGGRLVIGDLDYNCLSHYPLPPEIDANLNELVSQLVENRLWDPYAGRKLYRFFYEAGLWGIRAQVIAHHLFYGSLAESDAFNWDRKLAQMAELVDTGTISVSFDMNELRDQFMTFLRDAGRFSYTPLVLIDGMRPY